MANFNELKEKVMSTIGTVADMTKDFATQTGDKAKGVARIAKLSIEINNEKETVKKAYYEIGKLYYEAHHESPEGFFTQLCEEVSLANGAIADKEAEIAAIKSEMNERPEGEGETIEVEFETVVSESEEACDCGCEEHSHAADETCDCGCEEHAHGEQPKTPTAKVVDAVASAAREVAGAVKEAYKDITEKHAEDKAEDVKSEDDKAE